MKGLLLKDIYTLKATLRIYAVMIIIYRIIGAETGNTSLLYTFFVLACAIIPMTAIAYDDRCTWNSYTASLPVSRTKVALSKYVLGLLSLAFCIVCDVSAFFVSDKINPAEFTAALISASCTAVIYMSFTIPVVYKLGAEKSRIAILVVMLLPAAVIFGGMYIAVKAGWHITVPEQVIENILRNGLLIFSAVSILILIASMAVSVSIYKKRDF